MCGGETEAFARAKPYLEYMGGRIVHAGKVGSGLSVFDTFQRWSDLQ